MGRRPFAQAHTQMITYQRPTGVTRAGKLTYGAQATARAHVEEDSQVVRTGADTEEITSHWLQTYAPLVEQARVWVPGANPARVEEAFLVRQLKSAAPLTGGDTMYEARVG